MIHNRVQIKIMYAVKEFPRVVFEIFVRLEVKPFSKKTKRTFHPAQEVVLVSLSRKMNSPFQHVKLLGQLRPPCWILCFHCSTNAHQGPKIVTIPHNNSESPAFVVFLSSI